MISLLYPIKDRLHLFKNTIESIKSYAMDITNKFEIIVLDCDSSDNIEKYVTDLKNVFDIIYVKYKYKEKTGFISPIYAINLGFTLSKFDSVVVTSPEIIHVTPVIKQLLDLVGENVLCKVTELDTKDSQRKKIRLLMGSEHKTRCKEPGMYFIGMYNKLDWWYIGGIDERTMGGVGYEDRDFGNRFNRAGLRFVIKDEIEGFHQEHSRIYQHSSWLDHNRKILEQNDKNNVIKVNKDIVPGDMKYVMCIK